MGTRQEVQVDLELSEQELNKIRTALEAALALWDKGHALDHFDWRKRFSHGGGRTRTERVAVSATGRT